MPLGRRRVLLFGCGEVVHIVYMQEGSNHVSGIKSNTATVPLHLNSNRFIVKPS